MRSRLLLAALGAAVVLTVAVVGFLALRPGAEKLAPPAQTVQDLLELRQERSQDASAYAGVLEDLDLAVQLAELSRTESEIATRPPTPEWDPPYVSAETSSTAEVVVVWREPGTYADWPRATVFTVRLAEERWVVVDAEAIEATGTVPPRP